MADIEPNDDFLSAHNITTNSIIYATVNGSDTDDYYAIKTIDYSLISIKW